MTAIRHIGFYVNDIQKLEAFYTSVFQMIPVCSMEPDSSVLFDELLGIRNARILTTKLVTPYGKKNGQGDMLELVKILSKDTDFKTDCLKNLRGGVIRYRHPELDIRRLELITCSRPSAALYANREHRKQKLSECAASACAVFAGIRKETG